MRNANDAQHTTQYDRVIPHWMRNPFSTTLTLNRKSHISALIVTQYDQVIARPPLPRFCEAKRRGTWQSHPLHFSLVVCALAHAISVNPVSIRAACNSFSVGFNGSCIAFYVTGGRRHRSAQKLASRAHLAENTKPTENLHILCEKSNTVSICVNLCLIKIRAKPKFAQRKRPTGLPLGLYKSRISACAGAMTFFQEVFKPVVNCPATCQ